MELAGTEAPLQARVAEGGAEARRQERGFARPEGALRGIARAGNAGASASSPTQD